MKQLQYHRRDSNFDSDIFGNYSMNFEFPFGYLLLDNVVSNKNSLNIYK